jgi:toxin ParE1/3/4
LRGIRRYIAESSPRYPLEFLADLTAKIFWIAEVDFTGSPRDQLHVQNGNQGSAPRRRPLTDPA